MPGGVESRKRELACAVLGNATDLDPVSDYQIRAREGDNPVADTKAWESRGMIAGHDRRASVWSLVAKAAAKAAAWAAAWAADEAEKQA